MAAAMELPAAEDTGEWRALAERAFGRGLWRDLHIKFIKDVDGEDKQKLIEYHAMQYLRMSAVYWAVGAADLVS